MVALSLLLSVLTILDYWLLAERKKAGWVIGLAIQPIWVYYAVSIDQYGLIVMSVFYTLINWRGLLNHDRLQK